MPKKLKAPPSFLNKKLDDKTASFVRANVDPFLLAVRKQYKGKTFTALNILHDFFLWLGDRRREFRHL